MVSYKRYAAFRHPSPDHRIGGGDPAGVAFAVPLSLAIAVYLAELAAPRVREIVKPAVEVIASIPSVIIGFFGMVVVAPFLQRQFDLDTGLNLFNAAVMLAFMAVPTIASISEDAISSVPMSLKEASYALGGNRWQTIFHIDHTRGPVGHMDRHNSRHIAGHWRDNGGAHGCRRRGRNAGINI